MSKHVSTLIGKSASSGDLALLNVHLDLISKRHKDMWGIIRVYILICLSNVYMIVVITRTATQSKELILATLSRAVLSLTAQPVSRASCNTTSLDSQTRDLVYIYMLFNNIELSFRAIVMMPYSLIRYLACFNLRNRHSPPHH